MDIKKSASDMGKASAKKQFGGMTKEQLSEYFRRLRLRRRDILAKNDS